MSVKKAFRDTILIARLKSIPDLKRQPLIVVLLTLFAAIPLFFITLFGGEEMMDIGLVGVIVSSIGFLGITASIQDLTWDRYVKMREMVVAMPVHPVAYAMGLTLAALIFALPGTVVFMGLGVYRGIFDIGSILAAIGALIMCWLSLSVIGFTIATYQRKASPNTLGIIANLLAFVFVFMPPVYYSEELLGGFSWISMVFPTSNAAAIIRYSTGMVDWDPTSYLMHWLAMLLIVIIFSILVVKKARWREP
jgi:ABC-2 type transport system permease protein